jgi:8-oxo-dGTP diphosphatase
MSYTYNYPRPAVTVDCLIFCRFASGWHILLIQRDKPPFEGTWAFPGGFVDIDEPLPAAAERELEEETGLKGTKLEQFRTFGQPGRDPRGRTISVVYYGFIDAPHDNPQAGSDARNARWFDIHDLPPLAFDHSQIIEMALERLDFPG